MCNYTKSPFNSCIYTFSDCFYTFYIPKTCNYTILQRCVEIFTQCRRATPSSSSFRLRWQFLLSKVSYTNNDDERRRRTTTTAMPLLHSLHAFISFERTTASSARRHSLCRVCQSMPSPPCAVIVLSVVEVQCHLDWMYVHDGAFVMVAFFKMALMRSLTAHRVGLCLCQDEPRRGSKL